MIKQFVTKKAKITRGILNTYLRKEGENYNAKEWWDNSFYIDGVSDRQTISSTKSPISSRFHYNSVELQILRHLYNKDISPKNWTILDIGSGAGHWIDFYGSLGASKTVGLDISLSSFNYLKDNYSSQPDVKICHGKASEMIEKLDFTPDIVNAIGVMFHIVDDSEWNETISAISEIIKKNGLSDDTDKRRRK